MASKLITGGVGAGGMRGGLILKCASSLSPQPSQLHVKAVFKPQSVMHHGILVLSSLTQRS